MQSRRLAKFLLPLLKIYEPGPEGVKEAHVNVDFRLVITVSKN